MKKKDISSIPQNDLDESPELTDDFFEDAVMRVNMKPVEKKQRITILIDSGVVKHFKTQAGERGYQTLINDVLKKSIEQDSLEKKLRKIIREELGKGRMAG